MGSNGRKEGRHCTCSTSESAQHTKKSSTRVTTQLLQSRTKQSQSRNSKAISTNYSEREESVEFQTTINYSGRHSSLELGIDVRRKKKKGRGTAHADEHSRISIWRRNSTRRYRDCTDSPAQQTTNYDTGRVAGQPQVSTAGGEAVVSSHNK